MNARKGFTAVVLFILLLLGSVPTTRAADDCLSCHAAGGGLTNSQGKAIGVEVRPLRASVHAGLSCADCHSGATKLPHSAKSASASCLNCHPDAGEALTGGAHAMLGAGPGSQACITCHGAHNVSKPAARGVQLCSSCHETQVKEFATSIHGRVRGLGGRDVPSCQDCHESAHRAIRATDPLSPVSRVRLPQTCGRCHANPLIAAKYKFVVTKPVEAYQASVHGQAVQRGNMKAATCHDCHGVHDILPALDPRSRISKLLVADTCGGCHTAVAATYKDSIHGQGLAAGVKESPTCIDCHGEHQILAPSDPNSPVYVGNVSQVTCSRCHENQQLVTRYALPAERLASYQSSYHGMAAKAGARTVANCASCHGVHNILPSSDPRSTVAKANLPKTCGQCHADAGQRFAIGPIHVMPTSLGAGKAVDYVRLFYLVVIPLTLGFMLFHNFVDWIKKAKKHFARFTSSRAPVRMNVSERIQHAILMVSFTVLVLTGFALKYPESFWAAPIVQWEREFPLRGYLHRIAAVMLLGLAGYHLIYIALTREGRRYFRAMFPGWRDARDAYQTIGYNLGFRHQLPVYARFNYAEKIEYWALVWGTVLMTVTGLLLWAHNLVMKYLPLEVLYVSTAIHYYEAILATLAIGIWHFYAVIFDLDIYPAKWTFVTGRAPEHEVRADGDEQSSAHAETAKPLDATSEPDARSPDSDATKLSTAEPASGSSAPSAVLPPEECTKGA